MGTAALVILSRLHLSGQASDQRNVEAAFDVLTEIWLKDRATLDAMFAAAAEPRLAAEIAADEEKFADRQSVRMYVAEEYPRNGS